MTEEATARAQYEPALRGIDTLTTRHPVLTEGVRPLLLAAGVIMTGMTLFDLFDMQPPYRFPVVAHGAVTAIVCFFSWWAIGRAWVARRWAHPFVGAVVVLLSSNPLLTGALTGDMLYALYLPVMIIAAGSVMVSYAWLLGTSSVIALAYTVVAWPHAHHASTIHQGVALFASVIVATAIMHGRLRWMRRADEARRRERHLKTQAQEALDRAERELAERRVAESDRTVLEEQLRHAQKMEAVGALAGGVAHDMNNILAVITTLSSMWRHDTRLDAAAREDAAEMLAAAERGAALTSNLLGFARKARFHRERVAVDRVIDQVVELLQRTISKGIRIERVTEPMLDDLHGDSHQLGEVLMNLCINAVQAMGEEGTLTISARNHMLNRAAAAELPELGGGPYVEIEVRDTGHGMDDATRQQAFEPFFTTKPRGQGTGLGLAMVYGAVENHGGAVRLESEAGRGTTATLFIPAVATGETRIPVPRPTPPPLSGPGGVVLIVDDEPSLRRVASKVAQLEGLSVLTAENGAVAVEVFERHAQKIDLVLLDVAMPVMSGVECFRRIRAINPRARILVVSGYARGSDTEEMLRDGAADFLPKPFTSEQLRAGIRQALGRGS